MHDKLTDAKAREIITSQMEEIVRRYLAENPLITFQDHLNNLLEGCETEAELRERITSWSAGDLPKAKKIVRLIIYPRYAHGSKRRSKLTLRPGVTVSQVLCSRRLSETHRLYVPGLHVFLSDQDDLYQRLSHGSRFLALPTRPQ
jgi:hypothetical protein